MPGMAILFGIILILQGIVTYFLSEADSRSFTALIPAVFGALLTICGFIGKKPDLRKHAMHAAAAVALIGALGGFGRAIPALAGGGEFGMAVGSQLALGVLCTIFVILCVRSFIAARRAPASDV